MHVEFCVLVSRTVMKMRARTVIADTIGKAVFVDVSCHGELCFVEQCLAFVQMNL